MTQIGQAIIRAREALEECDLITSMIEQSEDTYGECEYVDGLYEWFDLSHETFLERIGELICASAMVNNDKQTKIPTT